MTALLVTLIAAGTLAFGAVYPWAYGPLFVAAALIGLAGLWRHGIAGDMRPVAAGLLMVLAAAAVQVVPLPRPVLDTLSPSTVPVLSSYNLAFGNDATGWAALSIDPRRTYVALAAFGALSLYLLGLPALLGERAVRALPRALALFAVPLALFAIYTRERNNGLIYGIWRSLDGGGPDQAGPFINRNHFAGWMVMALCLMVGWLLGQAERSTPHDSVRRRPRGWIFSDDAGGVLLMATAVVLVVISVFWTISRSAIVSVGVASSVLAWLVITRRRLTPRQRGIVVVMLGAVLLAGVSWRGPDVLVRWFLDERSLLSRMDAWRDGWEVVRDFPLFGTGLNTYSAAMLFYQTRNPGFHMAQAHNDYLQLLAEGGLLVVIPAAAAAVFLARAVRRSVRAARGEGRGYWVRAAAAVGLLAIALQEIVEFSLQIPVNALLFCTLAAVALARDNIPRPKERPGAALS